MQKHTLSLLLFLLFISCKDNKQVISLQTGLLISHVNILSSEDGNYEAYEGYVLLEQDKIMYVGKEKPEIKGEFEELDGTGKYLIPGLIDSHVHVTEVQGMNFDQQAKHTAPAEQFRKQVPRSYLYHGFTSLINLGGISEDQLEFFAAQPLSPEIYHTGRSGVSVPNGYPMNFVPEQFRFEAAPNFVFLESEADKIPEKFNPEDHSPKAVVKRIKESGAIAVKTYYESGFRNLGTLPLPTEEIITQLQQEADANDLVLSVHGNSYEAHKFLTDIGVDIITHGMWNWGDYKDVPSDSLPPEIKEVLDKQIEQQIGYTATLTVLEGEKVLTDPNFLHKAELAKVVPAQMIDWYKSEEGQWFGKDIFGDMPPEMVDRIYGNIQAHALLVLKYLAEHGGLILYGTDTPSAPTYGNPPGLNGYWELELMAKAGMSLEQILASATIHNAKAFHLENEIGSIAKGKRANLVLLSSNPLESIEAYAAIDHIILNGELIERESLSAK
ncbi:MAG: amidohydrolase family protein [Bacteroidia bacterium]|nr:amidohydrolase family protein [Bacteroidia bacterium]